MSEFPYWMQHGGHYRPIESLATPWVPSPMVQRPDTAPFMYVERVIPEDVSGSEKEPPMQMVVVRRRKRSTGIFKMLRVLFGSSEDDSSVHYEEPSEKPLSELASTSEVQLNEWKAWGYYARPKLPAAGSFEFFRNYPPDGPVSPSVDVHERFASLQRPSGGRWVPGLQHPALPPRPTRWKNPVIGAPQPFPWELQLNPFLQHRIVGLAPLCWDVSIEPARVLMGYDLLVSQNTVPLNDADKAQPATYPFVTHMYLNGIADFPLDHFPWPIMIHNDHGITCADVFEAIYRDFNLHISEDEFHQWNNFQQGQIKAAFMVRRGHERRDTARRYDLLGTHRFFRGLEPHPNLEGWMMFLGIA